MTGGAARRGGVIVAISCVLLLGTWLRFDGIDHKVFWFDELYSALWYSGHDLEQATPERVGRPMRPQELTSLLRLEEGSDLGSIIDVIIRDDPQHTPLYFVALRIWAGLVGDSIGALRSLSALADLLILPFLFWLCMELAHSRRVAWIAVALVALSPFHIAYSQEMRQYTLWMLLIVSSSAWFLWTLRSPARWKWLLYGLAVAAGLYTHLLYGLVVLAHAVYLGGAHFLIRSGCSGRDLRSLAGYGLATAGGLLLFSPWVWVIATHFPTAAARVSWSQEEVGLLHLVAMWASNYSAVFLDTNHTLKFIEHPGPTVYASFAARALILVPVAAAVLALLRNPRHRANLFLLALIGVPFLALALPDLLFGGVRSGAGNRYLAPSYLGVELAVASWLGGNVNRSGGGQRRIMTGTLVTILAAGVFSGCLYARSETWWHKSIGYFNGAAARIVNAQARPLVVSASVTSLLTLSTRLDEKVTVMLVEDPQHVGNIGPYGAVYVLEPDEKMRAGLMRIYAAGLEPVFPPAGLYALRVP